MPQSACSLSMGVDRATSSATGPQRRHLTFKPCPHLLVCHHLRRRLKQLRGQAIGAVALTLEIGPVTRCRCFEPRDLRLQCHDLCRQGDVACLTTTWWSWRMLYFREIHAHRCFAIIRKRARQPEPLGKRTSGLWRDCQAGAKCGIRQCFNRHRLWSSSTLERGHLIAVQNELSRPANLSRKLEM